MKTLTLQQGTPEWKAARANHFTASEAPVMMGKSPYKSRSDLIREKATGITEEPTSAQQKKYDEGHTKEALARPIAEDFLGEELFPATGVSDDDYLLASFDGISMLEHIGWEHKLWNKEKAALAEAGLVREDDMIQVQQQLMVSGAEKVLYTVSDGTINNRAQVFVEPDKELQAAILAGWKQFEKDIANYEHTEEVAVIVGSAPDALPALHIVVTGMVTASNLKEVEEKAIAVFENINTELSTDAHFADAAETVKWCTDVEKKLSAAKQHALSQTASIDELFRTIDSISEASRKTRLKLKNLVDDRKKEIRENLSLKASAAFTAYVDDINTRLGAVNIPHVSLDVADAMKGKKTISSLRDATDTALAIAKIEATEWSNKITDNLAIIGDLGVKHEFLFADKAQLVLKDSADVTELVKSRIIPHEAEEKTRRDNEREAIRLEEQAKLKTPEAVVPEAQAPVKSAVAPTLAHTTVRPDQGEIIGVLSRHYQVPEDTVIAWLSVLNFEKADLSGVDRPRVVKA